MPVFYFDFVQNGKTNREVVAQDLPDEHSAKREAVKTLAEIAAEEIPRDGKLVLVVAVSNSAQRIVFRAQLVFDPSPSID